MIKLFLAIIFGGLSLFTLAGNEVGNGGDVLVCSNKKIKSYELLDLYEGKALSSYNYLNSKNNYKTIVSTVIDKLKVTAPNLFSHYKKSVESFYKNSRLLDDQKLVDIKDSHHLVMPKNKKCIIRQIAILNKTNIDSSKFIIDKELWQKLDDVNKAALVTHEIIYEHFSDLGEKNSIKARKLNAFLFQSKTITKSNLWSFIKKLQLPIYH